jgi:hypothetical protein
MGQRAGFDKSRPYAILVLGTANGGPFGEVRVCETCLSLYWVEVSTSDFLRVDIDADIRKAKERGHEGGPQ